MTEQETQELNALAQFLGMIGLEDWHLSHQMVREKVLSGKYSLEFELEYKAMVDSMAIEREKDGMVTDGTPTHSAASCRHHGGCPYCERARTHANKRRTMGDDLE